MFDNEKRRLKDRLRAMYIEFPPADEKRVAALRTSPEKSGYLPMHDPKTRYQAEYSGDHYHSYKPGIDDLELGEFYGFRSVVEIGGGPSYLARQAPKGLGFCVDIVGHSDHDKHGVFFVSGDICEKNTVERTKRVLETQWKNVRTPCAAGALVALSYCLDRVPDQEKALRHFVEIMDLFQGGRGLITVCLPAIPKSPGSNVRYDQGTWITKGDDPIEQFDQIRKAVIKEKVRGRVTFEGGGLTTHYGVSLVDGFEMLPCYALWFSNGSKRKQVAPDLSHGWIDNGGATTRDAPEPWLKKK